MSADMVDDLHAAEDLIGSLTHRLRRVYANIGATAQVEDWCRPSCEDEMCSADCGCPCHTDGRNPKEEADA